MKQKLYLVIHCIPININKMKFSMKLSIVSFYKRLICMLGTQ